MVRNCFEKLFMTTTNGKCNRNNFHHKMHGLVQCVRSCGAFGCKPSELDRTSDILFFSCFFVRFENYPSWFFSVVFLIRHLLKWDHRFASTLESFVLQKCCNHKMFSTDCQVVATTIWNTTFFDRHQFLVPVCQGPSSRCRFHRRFCWLRRVIQICVRW